MAHIKMFEHLKISIDVIKSATNNFAEECRIGIGGFGSVYKGKIGNDTEVALKRLNTNNIYGQGNIEFWKEVMMLSQYKDENIVSLLGFCDHSKERILVYPYARNGSLDKHLNNKNLRWIGRLKICLGAAQGLAYLHHAAGTQQRVLHRDIKSSNILLDEDWNAKISDFGLSKLGPANQDYTFLYSHPVGTPGYVDPLYAITGLLTKESDVYSFGVVLFEVLCGTLCFNRKGFKKLVQKSYEENTINEIVYGNIKDEIHPNSLYVFATIAYQCLVEDREKRPLTSDILEALKKALHCQEARNDLVEDHTKRQVDNKLPIYPYLYCKQKDHAKAIGIASNSKNEDGGWLVVTIHEGVNLELKHPRVKLAIGTDSAFTTIKYDNLNLVWEESFRFTLKKPREEVLILTVYSASHMDKKVHNKDILGCVEINIADVVQVKHMNNTYQIGNGKIRVELRFLDYQNPSINSHFPSKDDAKAIDMAFKNEDAGVLVVTIHRGVNLEVKHPYVNLLVGTDKKHTTTKKHNHNPVWEESFHFTLDKPAEAILDLEVCSGSMMDRIHHKYNLGGVKIDIMDVIKQKHKNSIFHIGNGSIHAELHFLHSTRLQTLKH